MSGKLWFASLIVMGLLATGQSAVATERTKKNDDKSEEKQDESEDEKPKITRKDSDDSKGDRDKGTLDAFEDEVKKGSSGGKKSKGGDDDDDDGDSHSHGCDCVECGVTDAFALVMVEITMYTAGAVLVGTPPEFERPGAFHEPFARYPYRSKKDGLFSRGPGKPMAFALSANHYYQREDLTGWQVKGQFSPASYLTLKADYTRLTERRFPDTDNLAFGKFLVNFNRVRTRALVLYWGLGMRMMAGDTYHAGFAFDVGAEIYPFRPISLNAEYVGSWLGGRYVPEFTGTVNLHIGRTAIFAGYQYWSAGDVKMDGLVTGVKVFF